MSRQPRPPIPRVPLWAARLVLLVACAGTVATSPSTHETSAEYEGPTLRLTPEQPTLTRSLVAQISAEEAERFSTELYLMVDLTVTWTPTDPAQSARPSLGLKLRSSDPAVPPAEELRVVVIERPAQSVGVSSLPSCQVDGTCELPFTLTLQLQPGAPSGTLEVAWKVRGEASTYAALKNPKSFRLRLNPSDP